MPHNPEQTFYEKLMRKRVEHDTAKEEYNLAHESHEERPEGVDTGKVEAQVLGAYKVESKNAPEADSARRDFDRKDRRATKASCPPITDHDEQPAVLRPLHAR
jgi:hypothetical protein